MLVYKVTYKNFKNPPETKTAELQFHLAPREFAKIRMGMGGLKFEEWYKKISKSDDQTILFEKFEEIILTAYGRVEEDSEGEIFRKTPEMRNDFKDSAAYNALFDDFVKDEKILLNFMKKVFPDEMGEAFDEAATKAKEESGPMQTLKTLIAQDEANAPKSFT